MRMAGKTALITGGTTGIGFASAAALLREGARVAISGQNVERLDAARRQLGENVLAIRCDAASFADTQRMAAQIRSAFGSLDVLFLNAGIAKRSSLQEITEAKFDEMFGINVKGVVFPIQQLEATLAPGASIIVTTSINDQIGMQRTHLYAASKAAARALVRTLANELADRRIRVNAVCPGGVMTPIANKMDMSEQQLQSLLKTAVDRVPLKRIGEAHELAEVVLFLASDASSYITGQEIVVDGGWTGVSM
jgi:NAD(P)-dependent dehydrogenase (short-subunit alcohol dehydrogenase family)